MYKESTYYKKAKKVGYLLEKGCQHYTISGGICHDCNGNRFIGYMLFDLATGLYVWGSYDEHYTYLWQLEDVDEFLREVYQKYNLKW